MSLVNDMLRDLDSRRRQAPGRELGADKLIPATEFMAERRGFQFSKLVLPVLVILAVLAVTALFVFDAGLPARNPIATPIAVVAQPAAPVDVQQRDTAMEEAMLEEISRMAARVRELEAMTSNLPGLDATAQVIVPTAPHNVQSAAALDTQSLSISAPAATSSVPVWTPRAEGGRESVVSTAPVTQQDFSANAQVTESGAPMASTLVRSASELTFRDTDRLQVQQALQLWQGNQRNDALQMLEQFSAQNFEAHQSREMLAKLLMQQGDNIAAMEQADIGLAIAPGHSGYKKVKARAMMMAGVPRDAAELLQFQAPSLASDTEYHELLAAAQLAGQFYEEAVLTYQALTASDAEQARWWYGLGAAMDAVGRAFEAAQAYERAVQLGGLSPNLMQQSQQRIVAIRQN